MGVTAGHFADDEAKLLKQMNLHPVSTKLNSGTRCLPLLEPKKSSCSTCVSVDKGSLDISYYVIGTSKLRKIVF